MAKMFKYYLLSLRNLNSSLIRIILIQIGNKIRSVFSRIVKGQSYYMLLNEKMSSASWLLSNAHTGNGYYASYYTRTNLLKHSLQNAFRQFDLTGLYLEFGVCTGYTLNYMSSLFPELQFYGFDSFNGLPEDWRPEYKKGVFKIRKPKVNVNVSLIEGLFEQTLPEFINHMHSPIAFLHIDSDLYTSCKTIFKYCTPKITKGTIIVFDEFLGYIGWQFGEYKAFTEWVAEFNVSFQVTGFGKEQLAVEIVSINNKQLI